MLEFILTVLTEYIFIFPGAFLIWGLKGFKGSYSDVFAKQIDNSIFMGVIFWIVVAGLFWILANLI